MSEHRRDVFRVADKNGFYALVRVGGKLRRRKMGDTLREARQNFLQWEESAQNDSLQALVTEYLRMVRPLEAAQIDDTDTDHAQNEQIEPLTWQTYARTLTSFCEFSCPVERVTLGDKRASEIQPIDVQRYLQENRTRWGPSSRRARIQHIKTLMLWAEKNGWRKGFRSPLVGLRTPPEVKRDRVMTPDLFDRIIDRADPDLRELLILLQASWARPGELVRLEARDLTDDRRRAVLRKHKTRKKTGRGRTLYFPARVKPLLDGLCQANPEGPILRRSTGRIWTVIDLDDEFRKVVRSSDELPNWLIPYYLRHTGATEALAAGHGMEKVQQILGHTDIGTTLRFYSHIDSPEHRRSLEKVVDEVGGSQSEI